MKIITIVLSAWLALSLGSCIKINFNGTGNCKSEKVVTDSLDVSNFNRISASVDEVKYIPSQNNKVIWFACDDIADKVIAKVDKDGILHLGVDGNRSNHTVKFIVYGNGNISEIEVYSACEFEYYENIEVDNLKIKLRGASSFNFKGNVASNELVVDCSGASYFDAGNIKSDKFTINLHGASDGEIKNLQCDNLSVDLTGASSITLSGKCDYAEYDATGASEIYAENMIAKNAVAEASGASEINCNVIESISKSTSGASEIEANK